MEYAEQLSYDESVINHIGYNQNANRCIQNFFSKDNVNTISKKITELLMGVDPQNRPIIVPNTTIAGVMNDIYKNYRPHTGDIYSRYIIIPNEYNTYIQDITDQVIEVITSDVRVNLEMEENNRKLSIWTTVLGDFNKHGLQQHPQIKLRVKRPTPMLFNMNY